MSDNSKTIRSFQCRDALWEKFEQMARELECSVDYLINDSMKQYARQRGYGSTRGGGLPAPSRTSLQPPAPMPSSAPTAAPPAPGAVPPPPLAAPPPPPIGLGAPPPPPGPPPPRARSRTPGLAAPPPPLMAPAPPGHYAPPSHLAPPGPPPAPSRIAPPPAASVGAPPPPRTTATPRRAINVYYMGQRYTVTKDRFIIGRGKQSSDLTIKDPNVSRQHALVEFLNGQYYMVDMGSTNGVEYGGQRVNRHAINENDVFRVCDHELRFSYY